MPPRRRLASTLPTLLLALSLLPVAAAAEGGADRPAVDRQVARIAERAGISTEAAAAVLRSDAARVQPDGTVVFVDADGGHEPETRTAPTPRPAANEPARGDRARARRAVDVLTLHSDPNADQTIFLDVDGAELRGTDWNTGIRNLPDGTYPGYSLDADPALSVYEQQLVEQAWRETAAYFSAFDIDVTTEQPSRARLERSSPADREFGVWVVISLDAALEYGTCGFCGGVALLGQYDQPDGRQWQRPAFAFNLDPQTIAHEVGHTFGLLHDGKQMADGRIEEYYGGHGAWAPIMGGFGVPDSIAQWSPGDYPGATNTQDDYAVMAEHGVRWREDAAGSTTTAAASPGPETLGPDDVDVFTVPTCAGRLTVVAEVPNGGGLDVSLDLLDSAGSVVSSAARGVGDSGPMQIGRFRTGQSESLTDTSGRARFARVRGGSVPGTEGYPTYGSIGGYRLSAACDPSAPGAPSDLVASSSFRAITVSWQAPANGVVTGYRVWLDERSAVLEPGHRTVFSFAGPQQGRATVGVQALSGDAAGPRIDTTVTFPPAPTVRLTGLDVDRESGTALVSWTADISPEIVDARWGVYSQGDGGYEEASLPLDTRSHTLGRLPAGDRISVELCLRIPLRENSTFIVCDTREATYPILATAPTDLRARVVDPQGTVEVSWSPVDGASGYQVSVDRGAWRSAISPAQFTDLPVGQREVRVRAVNASGPGSAALTSLRVDRAPSPPRNAVATPSGDGTSIAVTWERPADDQGLTRYVLSVPDQSREVSLPPESTAYTLTGLTPGTRVDLFLQAAGPYAASEPVYLPVLLPGGPEPSALPVPTLEDVRSGPRGGRATLVVSWSSPTSGGTQTGWELSLVTADRGKKLTRTVRVPTSVSEHEVRLPKKRQWTVRVRSTGPDGTAGAWSRRSGKARAR